MLKKSTDTQQLAKHTAKLDQTLSLASSIVANPAPVLVVQEMKLKLADTLQAPTLFQAFRNKDQEAYATAAVLVNRFLESFQFVQKMSPAAKEVFIVDALECMQHESLQDMILFFKNARKGLYGAAKKGIDANLVFGEWFPQYLETKAQEREKVLAETKEKTTFITSQTKVLETYTAAKERKKIKAAHEAMILEVDAMVEVFDKAMLEDTIADWEKKPELKNHLRYLKKKRLIIKK